MKKKQKTTNDPWAPAQPYILQGLQNTQQVFNQQQPRLDAMGDTAYNLYGQLAQKAMAPSPVLQAGQASLNRTLGGDYLNSNPYASQMNPALGRFNEGLDGVTDWITNAARRAVGDQFTMAGRTGSPAEAITLSQHVGRELSPFIFGAMENQLGREFSAGESMLGRATNAYDAERQRMMQAASLAPSLRAAEFAGVPETLGALGSAAEIPWTGVNAYTGNIRNNSAGYGTQTTTSGGGLGGMIGLGLTAANMFGLSDRRSKEKIVHIGKTPGGLPVYEFNYIGNPERQVGVMADEVEKVNPSAVIENAMGVKFVDYSQVV